MLQGQLGESRKRCEALEARREELEAECARHRALAEAATASRDGPVAAARDAAAMRKAASSETGEGRREV